MNQQVYYGPHQQTKPQNHIDHCVGIQKMVETFGYSFLKGSMGIVLYRSYKYIGHRQWPGEVCGHDGLERPQSGGDARLEGSG